MARLDRKPAERLAVAALAIVGICFCLTLWHAVKEQCSTAWVLSWQLAVSSLVWAITLMRLRQARLADEEQLEWDQLQAERAAGGARGRLFEEDEIQAFTARNRQRILEKYITPAFSLIIAVGLLAVVGLTLLFNVVVRLVEAEASATGMAWLMCVFFALMFGFFLLAKYAGGMSRQAEWRPLRAAAGFMMLNTLFMACTVAAHAMEMFGYTDVFDDPVAYTMLGVMAILGFEILLNFALDFYRPRVEGVEERPAYDSRLLGLLLRPAGLFKTVSATLDYQFGFKISQSWFYRFTEQWIAPLLLFDILTLYALTCFVIVAPEQAGVMERFGKFHKVLTPGIWAKLPWPMDRVYRYPANEIKVIYLGHTGKVEEGSKILWTVKHYEKEYNVMVATGAKPAGEKDVPVNLLVATTTVRYKIQDVEKWYYSTSSGPEGVASGPEKLLEALCEREQIKYLAGVKLMYVMCEGREKASSDLKTAMQKAVDDVVTSRGTGLGVKIVGVGVEGMHPPVEERVPESFQEVVMALTQKETDVLTAKANALQTVTAAAGDAQVENLKAQNYYASRVTVAEAEAARFNAQNKAYGHSPTVFKAREYLSALEKGFEDTRKYVIAVKGLDREMIRVNLEDPTSFELGNIQFEKPIMPEESKK